MITKSKNYEQRTRKSTEHDQITKNKEQITKPTTKNTKKEQGQDQQ